MFGKKAEVMDKQLALGARPQHCPIIRSEEAGPGELSILVHYERPRWQQFMGAQRDCERTYILDKLGRKIYEWSDGETTVQHMIDTFVKEHHVSIAEAEYSITFYLKTLIRKGLIAMEVDKPKSEWQSDKVPK